MRPKIKIMLVFEPLRIHAGDMGVLKYSEVTLQNPALGSCVCVCMA